LNPLHQPAKRGDKQWPRSRAWLLCCAALLVGLGLTLTGCEQSPNMLDPRGPRAARIADLWWLMFWLGTAVYVIVLGLLFFVMFAPRARLPEVVNSRRFGKGTFVLVGGAIIPGIILGAVLIATMWTQRVLSAPEPTALTIEVTGFQFWWSVRYREHGIITANELYIPVGQRVQVELLSADVIHSFWVPRISEKLDMFPGYTNSLILHADEPGTYVGICAEFCGLQHARMQFMVVALPEQEFAAWVARQSRPAAAPPDELTQRGLEVYVNRDCVSCHSITGLANAAGADIIGPDLTHLASRTTLAAGTMDNTPGNLAAWIVNPQGIKPGNRMPNSILSAEELEALLAFLSTLE
jgi:cytochrome c oxidase subunit II